MFRSEISLFSTIFDCLVQFIHTQLPHQNLDLPHYKHPTPAFSGFVTLHPQSPPPTPGLVPGLKTGVTRYCRNYTMMGAHIFLAQGGG